jgi:4-amino-4-deoxy-L-arabinose transferase-like glycosyltransferase
MPSERLSTARLVAILAGGVWVLAFCAIFFSTSMQYNSAPRWQLWPKIPLLLLDLLPGADNGTDIAAGWSYFPPRQWLILGAAFIVAAAWSLGQLTLRVLKLSNAGAMLERRVLATAIGYAVLSLLTLGLGLAGLLSTWLFRGLLAVPILVETVLRVSARLKTERDTKSKSNQPRILPYDLTLLSVVIFAFLACMLLGALLPPTDFDVKEYHLEGPKEWFQAGQITFLEHNVYTSFPFLTEMLSLTGMVVFGDWFYGALAGKAVLMTFAPLTALALFCLARRWFSERTGWWAAAIYLTTPWIYRLSIIAYTEGALLCYLTVTLLAFDFARTLLTESSAKPLWLLTGFLAGSAMACKYPGLIFVVLPMSAAALYVCLKRNKEVTASVPVVKYAILFIAGGTLAVGPWLLKNAVQTGNPVYPLAWSVFGGDDWNAELQAKWKDAHSPPDFNPAALPKDLFEVAAGSDWQSPLLFAFAPLAFLWTGRRRTVIWLWVFVGWLLFSWWVFTHRIDRFWLPLIPPVCLLAGAGFEQLWQTRWKWPVGVVVSLVVVFNLGFIVSPLAGLNLYLADIDTLAASPVIQPPGIHALNGSHVPGDKVLSVGEANVFDARFPLAYNTVFDESLLERWCAKRIPDSDPPEWEWLPPEQIRQNFQQAGITHVLVNWSEILRYRLTYRYTDFVLPETLDRLVEMEILSPPEPLTFKVLKEMSDGEKAEVENKLSARVMNVQGEPALITNEVYRVVTEPPQ